MHLTDATIKRLPAPKKGNKITYDVGVPGFGCRVTAAGTRSFILNYTTRGGRERRHTIGQFPDWSTTAARARARELRRLIDDGGDPLADIESERKAASVADLMKRFEAEHLPRLRASSQADYRRMIENHIKPHFGRHIKVADVRFEDIDRLHRRITAAGHLHRANRVVAVLSKMFSLAIRWRMRTDNPVKGIERNVEHHRRRYLSGHELVRLTKALAEYPDQQAANAVRLLLLTGARRGEVLSMRWADVDLTAGTWSKPPSSTKQKEFHEVPLSAPARQLLGEILDAQAGKRGVVPTFVFPGVGGTGHRTNLKRPWTQMCKAAGITGLRIHDLRHSYASQLVSGGASLALVGALLGHSSPVTTARYSHLHHDPMREATERVGVLITTAGQPANEPVQLKPRRGR
jgi:integrase